MSYTTKNFKTKKALKDAVKNGEKVTCFELGLGSDLSNFNGIVFLEGPHYPVPHTWYAVATLVNGIVVKAK